MSIKIRMCSVTNGRLSGEVEENGVTWQIPPFEHKGKNTEVALLDRLKIIQDEAQLEKELDGE